MAKGFLDGQGAPRRSRVFRLPGGLQAVVSDQVAAGVRALHMSSVREEGEAGGEQEDADEVEDEVGLLALGYALDLRPRPMQRFSPTPKSPCRILVLPSSLPLDTELALLLRVDNHPGEPIRTSFPSQPQTRTMRVLLEAHNFLQHLCTTPYVCQNIVDR